MQVVLPLRLLSQEQLALRVIRPHRTILSRYRPTSIGLESRSALDSSHLVNPAGGREQHLWPADTLSKCPTEEAL